MNRPLPPKVLPPDLRLAGPGDLARVETIIAEAYGPWTPILGQPAGPLEEDYAAFIAAGQLLVYAPSAARVLGLLVLVPQEGAMLLDNVAVAAEGRGQGHGRALLEASEAIARAMGFGVIRLYTHEKMAANIAIYAARGYVETGRVTEKGRNRVYMEKRLIPGAG